MRDTQCPFCAFTNKPAVPACEACKKPFPWVTGDERLINMMKEREISRVRAVMTLVEDLYACVKNGTPIPVASIKGFVFSLLLPRTVVIVGSLLGAILLATQTYLIFRQYQLMDTQNRLLSRQTALEVFDKTSRFRDMLYAAPINKNGNPILAKDAKSDLAVAWPRPNRSAVHQIAQLASIDPGAAIPALQSLLTDEAGSVSGGSLRILEILRGNGFDAVPNRIGNFQGATLADADLSNLSLGLSRFAFADLSSASMQNGRFGGASFSRANLSGAFLSGASIIDANLDCSNLRGAELIDVDVSRASFKGADLAEADLNGIKNWQLIEDLTGANIDRVQNAPDGFIQWAISTKGAVIRTPKNSHIWQGDQTCKPRPSFE